MSKGEKEEMDAFEGDKERMGQKGQGKKNGRERNHKSQRKSLKKKTIVVRLASPGGGQQCQAPARAPLGPKAPVAAFSCPLRAVQK